MSNEYEELDELFTPREKESIGLREEAYELRAALDAMEAKISRCHQILDEAGVPPSWSLPARIAHLSARSSIQAEQIGRLEAEKRRLNGLPYLVPADVVQDEPL